MKISVSTTIFLFYAVFSNLYLAAVDLELSKGTSETNPTELSSDAKELNFKNLAGFKYEYPYDHPKGKPWELKEQFNNRVPEHIRKLNGQNISIKGFMLPVETKKDRVLSFLLMPDQQACCFGRVPEPNEGLVVDMLPQNGAPILMDQLIEIDGQLEVEEKWEDGFFVGIYHVDASGLKKSE